MQRDELEAALVLWGKEYGPGNPVNLGYPRQSTIQTAMDHHGFAPGSGGFKHAPIRTLADEVDEHVKRMEAVGLYIPSIVISIDYFCPNMAMETRIQRLRQIGVRCGRSAYYDYLHIAKAFLLGAMGKREAA